MKRSEHILLVVNPKAGGGGNDKADLVEIVREKVTERGGSLEVYETQGESDQRNICERLDQDKYHRILIAGGDGTINKVAHCLLDYDVVIGILPAGSANGLALNLDLPDELDLQIDVALGDHILEMDHLNVNGHTCLHIADLGLNAELIANFENSSIRGKFGYFLQSIPTLINTESPFDFTIQLNGDTLQRSGILLAIANAHSYGTGATINPDGKMDDGKFEILVFKSFDTLEIIRTLYDKADLDGEFAECHTTNHAVITAKMPIPFQIDGELMPHSKRVEVSFFEKKLRVAIP